MWSGRLFRVRDGPGACDLGIEVKAEFRRDDDLVATGGERFANQFLVGEGAVDFRGVEERYAAFDGGPDQGGHFVGIAGWAELALMPMQPSPMPEPPDRSCRVSVSSWLVPSAFFDDQRRYCSSVTCSIQSTGFPSSFSWMAMWLMAVVGVAPCQCFSPGANQTTSPGRISSIGPPSR